MSPPIPTGDPEELRRAADEVLARREFADPDESLLARGIDWVLRRLDELFGGDPDRVGFDVGQGGSGGSAWFTVLLLVAAVAAVVLVLRASRGSWRRRPEPPPALDVEVEAHRSPADWEELARRLEAEGRWQEGMRARFGALVGSLADAGLVPDVPGRTSGEYRADVAAVLPEAAGPFADAADLFERAWYGALPTGPAEAERFADDARRVLVAAGAVPA